MLYTENSSMHHYVGFLQIGSHIQDLRFHGSLYKISASCWHWHFIMLRVASYSNCKQFLVYIVCQLWMQVRKCSSSSVALRTAL